MLPPIIPQRIEDSPYTFVRRIDHKDIELAYGKGSREEVRERWRAIKYRAVGMSSVWIKVRGRWYRFAGRLRTPAGKAVR